ncbi:unnamed protein product [Euphydryas editha]|uniref:Uncharacterized protein n=1 Tax=Euphydryas editha TaxID=104508 RepID=A0AAU9UNM2_EUPED|nr:unnamed protein product [Euphydryas editha]
MLTYNDLFSSSPIRISLYVPSTADNVVKYSIDVNSKTAMEVVCNDIIPDNEINIDEIVKDLISEDEGTTSKKFLSGNVLVGININEGDFVYI